MPSLAGAARGARAAPDPSAPMSVGALLLIVAAFSSAVAVRPIVLLHGMLATNNSMNAATQWALETFPGVYTHNLYTGDRLDAVLADLNTLCAQVASLLKADAKLSGGFNAIGHSQGGLLLRCYVERYMHLPGYPRMHNLISWLGVQNGVFGVPDLNEYCPVKDGVCKLLDELFDTFLTDPKFSYTVQDHVTCAAFWKDPLHFADYLALSDFLADVNNERPTKNAQYRSNLMMLDNFVCIYGLLDMVVIPRTSPIFSFFAPGNVSRIVPFEESGQYTQDWLGLATLQRSNRLHFASVNCSHTGAPSPICKSLIWPLTVPFLNN